MDPQTVIDALVLGATKAIDAKVADGTLGAEQATQIKANLVERTTQFVNEGAYVFITGRREPELACEGRLC